jgi:hypothetical protein
MTKPSLTNEKINPTERFYGDFSKKDLILKAVLERSVGRPFFDHLPRHLDEQSNLG